MADVSRVRINNNEYLVKDSQARNAITELQNNQVTSMQNLSLRTIVPSTASFPSLSIGDTGKIIFGKINKWFSDVRAALATKLNTSNVYNKLDQNKSGYALDARQGKTLNDKIDQRISVSGVTGMQIRGSSTTNNVGLRVFKNSQNTAWTQETFSADAGTIVMSKKDVGSLTETILGTIHSAAATLKRIDYSYTYTVAANSSVAISASNFNMATPSGYMVAGMVNYNTSNQYVYAYRVWPQTSGLQTVLALHNTSNSSITATATITILYVKSIMNATT